MNDHECCKMGGVSHWPKRKKNRQTFVTPRCNQEIISFQKYSAGDKRIELMQTMFEAAVAYKKKKKTIATYSL